MIENFVGLRGFVDECTSFEDALEILNQEGSKYGVAFKRGNIHYSEDKTKVRDRRIICSKAIRNKQKSSKNVKNDQRESFNKIEQLKAPSKPVECPVYYKFTYNDDEEISFQKCEETHNHSSEFSTTELTQAMLHDIKLFPKRARVIDIKESLEKKYKVQLDYNLVYRKFRKIYPRFGQGEAEDVKKILEERQIPFKIDIDSNSNINRLFMSTPRMIRNYELYGDVMLIDSTYRINQYNIPLVVYSGLDSGGYNILFGLAIINDESAVTHQWCLEEFFKIHKKYPAVCITDQDLALSEILDKNYKEIVHLLCQWHIDQNLKKYFSYLQNLNLKGVYQRILSLPHILEQKTFEDTFNNISEILQEKNYTKSSQYLARVYQSKLKWATSYVPKIFTAGIHTTSRVESINALIKKYVNSNSEVSEIFEFIVAFERKQLARIDNQNIIENEKQIHPLLDLIKPQLSGSIFKLHDEQYKLCFRYRVEQEGLNILNMQKILILFSKLKVLMLKTRKSLES